MLGRMATNAPRLGMAFANVLLAAKTASMLFFPTHDLRAKLDLCFGTVVVTLKHGRPVDLRLTSSHCQSLCARSNEAPALGI